MITATLQKLVRALRSLRGSAGVARSGPASVPDQKQCWYLVDGVMSKYHFTPEAQMWLHANVNLCIDNLGSTGGGGYWQPSTGEVRLYTAQHEAAVHELAHAWWHSRREPLKDQMIEAVVRLSAETNPAYASAAKLAFGYAHGIPAQNWPGMLVDRNDWEMFAGLASGTMGDMSLLPPYVRRMYRGLFVMPPVDERLVIRHSAEA